jgi:serine/threonine protein phosphatase PrpC
MEILTRDLIIFDGSMDAPQLAKFAGGHVAYFSRRCPDKETANEDALALLPTGPNAGILAVADGCGGMAHGDLAARIAVEALQRQLIETGAIGPLRRMSILDGMESASQQVQDLSVGAATTMAILEIDEQTLRPYHAGDSAILLVGNRGRIKLQTTSHSPVGYAIMAGVLDERDAIHHEDRHLVSNVLGDPDAHIEIGAVRRIQARDTALIGSDGLFDNLHVEEIVECIRKGPLAQSAQRLAELASGRMAEFHEHLPCKPDDLTFILFRPR